MFNFGAVLSSTLTVISDAMAVVDPSTLFGGLVTVSLAGAVMVTVIRRVRRLIR